MGPFFVQSKEKLLVENIQNKGFFLNQSKTGSKMFQQNCFLEIIENESKRKDRSKNNQDYKRNNFSPSLLDDDLSCHLITLKIYSIVTLNARRRSIFQQTMSHPTLRRPLKTNFEKKPNFQHFILRGKVSFKKSSPSIMVTRNPNWLAEILQYGTSYAKEKILSPLKRST